MRTSMHSRDEGADGTVGAASHGGEAQFHRLLDKLPVAAYTCDRRGLITYFNEKAVEVWGRAPALNDAADRFCGSFKLFAADGSPVAHADCWMALTLRNAHGYNGQEIVIERPDGRRVTVLAHASPVRDDAGTLSGAVNILIDISGRKRSQEALISLKNELAAQLADLGRLHHMSLQLAKTQEMKGILEETLHTATAIDHTDMGLLSLFDATGTRLQVQASLGFNEEFLNAVDATLQEQPAWLSCCKEQRRVVVEDVETDSAFDPHRSLARMAGFRAVHITPLISRSGRTVGTISTHFDAPHRPSARKMELLDLCARQATDFIDNAHLYGELREADRAKNEFLAMLAHELRNPLAPIRSAVQFLQTENVPPEASTWAQNVIERQVVRLTRLVDDLLDISRITNGRIELRKERCHLAEVVRASVEISRPLIDAAGLRLSVTEPEERVLIDGDVTRLTQVLSNLLNNATKYTDRGGVVELTAARQGNEVMISVRDTGMGIPAELLPRIFDMFVQAPGSRERAQGGLGVGLTLVRRLVELHDGSVTAHSDGPGRGSEFTVRIPMPVQNVPAVALASTAAATAATATPLKILVVDDHRDAAECLGMILRTRGNEVRSAYDGLEAVAAAAEFRPDLVLLDVGLPKLNGYDAAERIRAQPWGRRMMLVALTGWGHAEARERSRQAGFDRHLVKPVEAQLLREVVERASSRRMAGAPVERQ